MTQKSPPIGQPRDCEQVRIHVCKGRRAYTERKAMLPENFSGTVIWGPHWQRLLNAGDIEIVEPKGSKK